MADKHTSDQRRFNMQQVKGTNTKPEILVRKHLFSRGFRYRINYKGLTGKPDIVIKKYKLVIFVNGCFWHKHDGCKHFVMPKTRIEFWSKKISDNVDRDKKNYYQLIIEGWKVIVIWECELKKNLAEYTLDNLVKVIENKR